MGGIVPFIIATVPSPSVPFIDNKVSFTPLVNPDTLAVIPPGSPLITVFMRQLVDQANPSPGIKPGNSGIGNSYFRR